MSVCYPRELAPVLGRHDYGNLATPTDDDLDGLAEIIGIAGVAYVLPPVIGLCSRCDATAIDGLCMTHAAIR
jgi:hypothetical protein